MKLKLAEREFKLDKVVASSGDEGQAQTMDAVDVAEVAGVAEVAERAAGADGRARAKSTPAWAATAERKKRVIRVQCACV